MDPFWACSIVELGNERDRYLVRSDDVDRGRLDRSSNRRARATDSIGHRDARMNEWIEDGATGEAKGACRLVYPKHGSRSAEWFPCRFAIDWNEPRLVDCKERSRSGMEVTRGIGEESAQRWLSCDDASNLEHRFRSRSDHHTSSDHIDRSDDIATSVGDNSGPRPMIGPGGRNVAVE